MDAQTGIVKTTKFLSLALAWTGKGAIVFLLIAVLGYTLGLYGLDVQLRPSTPTVQVHLIVFDSMPRLSWRKLIGLFHSLSPSGPAGHEQACRQNQKQPVG
ncbi:MAG TPA: hypothetical protein VF472_25190 [Burkholderiaceae bacterium]